MAEEWTRSIREIEELLTTHALKGLSSQEVVKRQSLYGFHTLAPKKRVSPWRLLWSQFCSPMVWLLFGAALIALLLGDVVDASAIIAILALNGVLGFFQEYRAETSLEELQKIQTCFPKVIRNGELQTISSEELVIGDLVYIEAGDQIPADGRVVAKVHLRVNESMLTGESTTIEKTEESLPEKMTPIADQKNMVFMGTFATEGKGYFLVTAVGNQTQMGQIAIGLNEAPVESTPLQKELALLGKRLVFICIGIIIFVFVLGIWRGNPLIEMMLTALSLAVAAVPEGLPIAVTIALSIGIAKMAKKQALVRRLSSIETLGCTEVICTDKTGTLTENRMVVRYIWIGEKEHWIEVTGEGYTPIGSFLYQGKKLDPPYTNALERTFQIGMLCTRANVFKKDTVWCVSGDPTEGALVTLSAKGGMNKEAAEQSFNLKEEIPFDSDRKMMSVKGEEKGNYLLLSKGAPARILEKSTHLLVGDIEKSLSLEEKKTIEKECQKLASTGYRTLALAYRKEASEIVGEENLVFVSLVAIVDPPREGVKEAIALCKKAGIQTVMITGDHKETAMAIGKQIGLYEESSLAIEGVELDQMNDEEFDRALKKASIFARISAHHKLRIIHRFQHLGKITAMTGDGVNDATAVHAADIGIAMGVVGSDVTKQASDLVLLDDKFTSIVDAIALGRGIYENILKFLSYLLTSNIAEILVIFIALLANFKDPTGHPFMILLPVQLLWINLITDGLPVMSLALDPTGPHVMDQKPRNKGGLLGKEMSWLISIMSLISAIGVIIAAVFGLKTSQILGQTMAFTTLVVLELVKAILVRVQYANSFFSNRFLLYSVGGSFVLQLGVIYLPLGKRIFRTTPLFYREWGIILGITLFVSLVNWMAIYVQKKRKKEKNTLISS